VAGRYRRPPAPVAAIEIVAAFDLFEDHRIEPLPERHARTPGRELGRLARLGLDPLHAPRNARLHLSSRLFIAASGPPATSRLGCQESIHHARKVNGFGKYSVKCRNRPPVGRRDAAVQVSD
jgi:hypothetical protein